MKILRTQGAILCVAGVRKFTFSTPIVTTTENVTRIMVKSRYWLVTVIKRQDGLDGGHLAKEGDGEGGGRDDLGQEEEEHSEREQDRDGEGDLKKVVCTDLFNPTQIDIPSNIFRFQVLPNWSDVEPPSRQSRRANRRRARRGTRCRHRG